MILQITLENYLLIKALHLVAVISWMAGMLYLPRLFVYHARVKKSSPEYKLLLLMEYRLLRYIMTPAMLASFLLGFLMIWASGFISYGKWLHVKLMLVFAMASIHGLLAYHLKRFVSSTNTQTSLYFRILNEIPTILIIFIVLLVIMKPW